MRNGGVVLRRIEAVALECRKRTYRSLNVGLSCVSTFRLICPSGISPKAEHRGKRARVCACFLEALYLLSGALPN